MLQNFIENLKYKFIINDLFFIKGRIPKTDNEKYWFSRGLQESVKELGDYQRLCDSKYKSLIEALSQKGFTVLYDERTNMHIIHQYENSFKEGT